MTLASMVLFGFGGGIAQYPFYLAWSQELFPTMLRATGQGLIYGVVRIAIGFWSFFVPVLAAAGTEGVARLLVGFLAVSGLVGTIRTPNMAGKSAGGDPEGTQRRPPGS